MAEIEQLLAGCLEAMERGAAIKTCLARYPEDREELEPLLRAAQRVRTAPMVGPSPDFRKGARERMVMLIQDCKASPQQSGTAETAGLLGWLWARVAPAVLMRRIAVPTLAALSVILLVGVLGVGGVYASSDAVPGDHLYSVKLAGERLRLALARDETAQAELHLRLAGERLEEAEALVEQDRSEEIQALMRRYAAEMEAASGVLRRKRDRDSQDPPLSALIQEQMAVHQSVLSEVWERVPEAARPAVEQAIAVSKGAGIGPSYPQDQVPAVPSQGPGRTMEPTQPVTPTRPSRAEGTPTAGNGEDLGRPDGAGTVTLPGRTRPPEAPGLTMTPQPPGRTRTPQPPGQTRTPMPPGQTRTPAPPVQTPTPRGPVPGVTTGPPDEPGPPDPPDPPGPPEEPGRPGQDDGAGPSGQGGTPGRP